MAAPLATTDKPMNKLLTTLPALVFALGAVALSDAGAATAKSDDAASQPARKAAASKAKPAASAASANEAGVNPAKAAEPTKGPPKQMKQTEAQSNSSK